MGRRNQGPRLRWLKKLRTFYVFWTEGGRSRERSTGTADRKKAEIFLAEWLTNRQRRSGPSDPSELFVTDALVAYGESAIRRAEAGKVVSPDRISYAIVPLATFFKGRTCGFISEESCVGYRLWRGRATGTIRRELGVLRAALNMAYRKNWITLQISVELPEAPLPKDRWLTRSEAAALLHSARNSTKSSHLVCFILLALYCGKRKEAILSLRWSQVDLDAGVIDWERRDHPVTKKRRGRNPVNPKLLRYLRRARRYGSELGPIVAYNGRPVKDVKKAFSAACERAGLEGVTTHTLRHTCCSWLAQRGIPTWQAAGFVGMSEPTFLKVYGHHHPDFQREAATAF